MLVLLSAPRGRVSAARLLATLRGRERVEARAVIHLPGVSVAAEPDPPAAAVDGAGAADGARWQERGAGQ